MSKYINVEDLHNVVLKRKTEYGSLADLIDNIVEEMVKETPYVDVVERSKVNKAIEEMKALVDPKNTILEFDEKMGVKTAMNILVRSIREGECNLSEKPIGSESEDV